MQEIGEVELVTCTPNFSKSRYCSPMAEARAIALL